MTDWAQGVEVLNYGIKRRTDRGRLMELLQIPLTLSLVGMICFFYLWQRSQITAIGYETQRLQQIEKSLVRAQKALILEEETLKDPQRIDDIARGTLGMTPLHPRQIVPAGNREMKLNDTTSLALARAPHAMREPRKAGLRN